MTVSVNQIVASPYGNVTAVTNPVTGGIEIPSVGIVVLVPSGDQSFYTDSQAMQETIDYLAENGGGNISLLPGTYFVKDVELKSGVSITCDTLPAMNFNQVCADLGFNPSNPFNGGAIFQGTGIETVFKCKTVDYVRASGGYDANDIPISGVRLSGLVGYNIKSLLTAGAQDQCSLAFSVFEHLYGYKISGTFIDLVNIQHINGRNFKSVDCNHALRIGAYHSACQPGNSHFSDIYNYSWAEPAGNAFPGKSTDWAIKLDVRDTGRAFGGGLLNYVTLNGRIQCNAFRDTVLNRTRGNCAILVEGTPTIPVNLCQLSGTDIEGKVTYGIVAKNTTGLRIKVDGWSNFGDFVAGIKVKNSLQMIVESNSYDTSMHIDGSSVYMSGFLRYYAIDNLETNPNNRSNFAKGIYTVFAGFLSTDEPPTYTPLKTNGVTFMQLGSSRNNSIQYSESENVLRPLFVPIANQIVLQTTSRTWVHTDAARVMLSGAVTTQTLPIISSVNDGVEFTFKATDGNAHTIATQSGQLIDGAATYSLAAGLAVTIMAVASGTKWIVIAKG